MTQTAGKIRVCFISMKAYPIFNPAVQKVFGGAEVDLYLLATELAKDERYEVSFIAGDYGQTDAEVREGVRIYKSLDVQKNLFVHSPKIWKALKKADADIYMSEACSLGTFLIALFCKTHRRHFVYRTASSREANGMYFRKNLLRAFFVRWAFRQADPLIVQNEQDANHVPKTIGRNAVVIRNACHLRSLVAVAKKGVLWVGRSETVKRPDLFLKLAAAFPDTPFTMVCQGATGDSRYPELIQQGRRIGNLTFIERVPFVEIDRWFEQAAAFVNTSDSEGFPNTFVQAAKSATPILSLRVNPDNFLRAHNCGRCADGDWVRFCALLREMMETPLGAELGQNGQAYIQLFHNIETIIQTYKDILLALHK